MLSWFFLWAWCRIGCERLMIWICFAGCTQCTIFQSQLVDVNSRATSYHRMMHYRALRSVYIACLLTLCHDSICESWFVGRVVLTAWQSVYCTESEWRAARTTTLRSHSCSGVACRQNTRVTANQVHHKKCVLIQNRIGTEKQKAQVMPVRFISARIGYTTNAKQGRTEKVLPAEWHCSYFRSSHTQITQNTTPVSMSKIHKPSKSRLSQAGPQHINTKSNSKIRNGLPGANLLSLTRVLSYWEKTLRRTCARHAVWAMMLQTHSTDNACVLYNWHVWSADTWQSKFFSGQIAVWKHLATLKPCDLPDRNSVQLTAATIRQIVCRAQDPCW